MPKGKNSHDRDALHKVLAQAYKGKSFAVYGIALPPIRELFPAVPVDGGFIDSLFLLEDGTYAVVECASGCHKADVIKYPEHIAEIMKRYDREDGRFNLHLIIIYTGDVEKAESVFDFGCLALHPEQVFLSRMDRDAESESIGQKIRSGLPLTDDDLMELIVLPLAIPDPEGKTQLFDRILAMAEEIPDEGQPAFVPAAMAHATEKYINR